MSYITPSVTELFQPAACQISVTHKRSKTLKNKYLKHSLLLTALLVASACSNGNAPEMKPSPTPIQANCPVLESKDWVAWLNRMPGPDGASLHISGKVVMPTPGYNIEVIKGPLDRRQPPAQRLRLNITPPPGMVPQVLTTQEVKASFLAQASAYRAVIIGCGDKVLAEITNVETVY